MNIPSALAQTIEGNHQKVKEATEFLQGQEKNPEFAKTLLQVITSDQPSHIRHAASIYFKNYLSRYWPMDENQDWTIPSEVTSFIKENIVALLINSPPIVQKQVFDCIELIAITDFPQQWPNILPQLIQQTGAAFTEKNLKKATDLLKATNSLLRRYRTIAYDDEQTNKELAIILDHVVKPLMEEFRLCRELITAQTSNGDLQLVFGIVHQLYRIFYSLIYVTIPAVIEDNLKLFMEYHMFHLKFKNTSDELLGDDEDKPGILLKVQASICQNITVFVEKYEEEFQPFIGDFMQAIWDLLTTIDHSQPKYDNLISRGMEMLTTVSKGVSHGLLENEQTLKQICEKIVIPNLMFREDDEINFEEEHLEYIRTDLEESNHLTRRSTACELVQGLRKHNEVMVTTIFASYVMQLLGQYNANKAENWKQKDIAFFLISALTISGGTRAQGITIVNERVPIMDFFKDQVVPEFQQYPNNHPVIQADALKFVITFRNQIGKDFYGPIFQCALKMLGSSEYVVSTYAASCMERLLTVRDSNTFRFGPADLKPFINGILTSAFEKLCQEKSQNNDYIMRLVMRVLATSKGDMIEFAQPIMEKLQQIIMRIAKNPTIPAFDHYVFESVACLCSCLHSKDPALVSTFETGILPTLSAILQTDTANFSPYVYQLLSMFLELTPSGGFSDAHKELLNHIIAPGTWKQTGNIPALTRLVQAYLRKDIQSIIQMGKLSAILGVFQNLLSSALQDHHGMAILHVVIEVTPWDTLASMIQMIFTIIFKRLQSKKTTKLCCEFTLFLCRFIHKYSLKTLHEILEKITPGILANVLGVWSVAIMNIVKQNDIQVVTLMTASILVDPLLCQSPYSNHWLPLAKGVAHLLFEMHKPPVEFEGTDEFEKQQNQQLGVQTSFIKLFYSDTSVNVDSFIQHVSKVDRTTFVVEKLRPFIAANAQTLQPVLQQLAADKNGKKLCEALN